MLEQYDGKWVFADRNDFGRATLLEVRMRPAGGGGVEPDAVLAASAVQDILIVNTIRFGKMLCLRVINGDEHFWPQFAEADEHHYHHLLVTAALFAHPKPQRVLILGGGDYLAAWRVLMRRGVEYVKIADWDPMVGTMVCEHMPWVGALGIHDHPRVDWKEAIDIREYLMATNDVFDVVIGDLTDITAMGALVPRFLERIIGILKPGGVFATQAGPCTPIPEVLEPLRAIVAEFREYFPTVWLSAWPIESFNYPQAVLTGWKDRNVEPTGWSHRRLVERFDMAAVKRDRPFLDGRVYRAMFAIPRDIHSALGVP